MDIEVIDYYDDSGNYTGYEAIAPSPVGYVQGILDFSRFHPCQTFVICEGHAPPGTLTY